jgi:hypothetical protein
VHCAAWVGRQVRAPPSLTKYPVYPLSCHCIKGDARGADRWPSQILTAAPTPHAQPDRDHQLPCTPELAAWPVHGASAGTAQMVLVPTRWLPMAHPLAPIGCLVTKGCRSKPSAACVLMLRLAVYCNPPAGAGARGGRYPVTSLLCKGVCVAVPRRVACTDAADAHCQLSVHTCSLRNPLSSLKSN